MLKSMKESLLQEKRKIEVHTEHLILDEQGRRPDSE